MKMKKTMALVLALCMLLMTACGDTAEEDSSSKETTAATTAAETTAAEAEDKPAEMTTAEAVTEAPETTVTEAETTTEAIEEPPAESDPKSDLAALDKVLHDFVKENGIDNFNVKGFNDLLVNTLGVTSEMNTDINDNYNTIICATNSDNDTIRISFTDK